MFFFIAHAHKPRTTPCFADIFLPEAITVHLVMSLEAPQVPICLENENFHNNAKITSHGTQTEPGDAMG